MNNNLVKLILVIVGVVVLSAIAISLLSFAIRVLLPIAILVIAGYIVYKFLIKRKY